MIRTLPILLGATLLSCTTYAQGIHENFDNGLPALSGTCWQLDNVYYASATENSLYLLQGKGSIYSDPPVNDNNFRTLATPFVDVAGTLTISFDYRLSSALKVGATRILEAGLLDKNGVFTPLGQREILTNSSPVALKTFRVSTGSAPAGVYRVAIRMGGTLGDGNARLLIDNLNTDAPLHYGGGCNPAPTAADDDVVMANGGSFSVSSLLGNDSDPGGERLKAVLVSNSADGNIKINDDGTFTFTASEGFAGNSTSFTYKVVDDGYSPASSNSATVRIKFEEAESTVLQIVSFTGKRSRHEVQLQWVASLNELVQAFEVEQSSDGRAFTSLKTVGATERAGDEHYEVRESEAGASTFYRLKVVNKKGAATYSPVIRVAAPGEGPALALCSNPVVSTLQARYTAADGGRTIVTIHTAGGSVAYIGSKDVQKGLNLVTIDAVQQLRPGTYVLTITNNRGERITSLFQKM